KLLFGCPMILNPQCGPLAPPLPGEPLLRRSSRTAVVDTSVDKSVDIDRLGDEVPQPQGTTIPPAASTTMTANPILLLVSDLISLLSFRKPDRRTRAVALSYRWTRNQKPARMFVRRAAIDKNRKLLNALSTHVCWRVWCGRSPDGHGLFRPATRHAGLLKAANRNGSRSPP